MLKRLVGLFVALQCVQRALQWPHLLVPSADLHVGAAFALSPLGARQGSAASPPLAPREPLLSGTSRLALNRNSRGGGRSPSRFEPHGAAARGGKSDRQEDPWYDEEVEKEDGAWGTDDEAEGKVILDPFALDDEDPTEEGAPVTSAQPTAGPDALLRLEASSTDAVSYFYLKNELGLSEEAMWRVTFEAGSALGMTSATLRRKVELLRDNLNLTPDDVRTILERQPTILQLSADKNLAPTILFLVRALDLGKDELRSLVVESPSVLTYKKDNLVAKINFFTRLMGYSIAECRELLLAEPKLLRCGVATSLVPTMRFFVRDVEIPLDRLRALVKSNPRVLLFSLGGNLVPKIVHFLIMTLQMTLAQVQKLLVAYPQFLDYNLDRHTLPIATYLMKDLEYSPNEMTAILLKFPRLVTYQLARIKNRVGYLRYELDLSASQVKRVLYQNPQLVGLAFETLRDRVAFLQESLLLSPSELRTVVAGMPTLLVLNPSANLQPKLKYLLDSFGGRPESVPEAVVRLPTLLGYSLEKRIRPRMERILRAGLDPASITIGIPMPEDRFSSWLERRTIKLTKERLAIVRFDGAATAAEGSDQRKLPQKEIPSAGTLRATKGVVHWTRERRPLP